MSIKNYSVSGVGSDLQFGKKGGRLVFDGTGFLFTDQTGGTNYVTISGATPTSANHLVTKAYADSLSGGLKPLASVSVSTQQSYTIDGSGATVGGGVTWSAGVFSNFPITVDGKTLTNGDRVLVRLEGITLAGDTPTINNTGAARNGIYYVSAVQTTTVTLTRATELDSSAEFVFGLYTLVNQGTDKGNGYTLVQTYNGDTGVPPQDIDVDPQFWVKYSSSSSYTASNGVVLNGSNIELEISNLGDFSGTIDSTAIIPLSSSGTDSKTTISKLFNDLNVVSTTGITSGLLVKTADDTYAGRSVVANSSAGQQGITLSNGDGVSGNVTVGLNIGGLTAASSVSTTNTLIVFDGTNNVRATVQQVADAILAGTSSNTITQGNSSVSVTDSGTNGTVTTVLDGTTVSTLNTTGLTLAVPASVGNISINGSTNTISSTDTNGNIILAPNGTGEVIIQGTGNAQVSSQSGETLGLRGDGVTLGNVADTINFVTATNSSVVFYDTSAAQLAVSIDGTTTQPVLAATGTATDIGIILTPKGNGKITVSTNATTYATGLSDGDLVNKKYVDTAVAGASGGASQTEVDNIEASVGLNTDGTLAAYTGTNYLNSATTIKQATTLLDTAVAAKSSQTEVDAIETGAGLNSDGTYTAPVGTNYLGSSTSLKDATTLLDTQIKANSDAIAALGSASGSVKVAKVTGISLASSATATIISSGSLPASGLTVKSIKFNVTSGADNDATVIVQRNATTIADATTNDPAVAGLYVVDLISASVAGQSYTYTVTANSATTGTIDIYIEYIIN